MGKTIGLVAVGVLASVVALGGALPAAAQDDATDEQRQGSVQGAQENVQGAGVCGTSGWVYRPGVVEVNGFMPIGVTQANRNGTASPAQVTFSSTASGTMSASADGSLSVDLSAKLASINTALGTSLTMSMTAEFGTTIEITVPPGQVGYGEFGIWNSYVTGEELHIQAIGPVCNIIDRKSAGVLAPYRSGWNTWTGN